MSTIECGDARRGCGDGRRGCIVLKQRRSPVGSLFSVLLAYLMFICSIADVAHGYPPTDAYDRLQDYGFPIGLLPHTVIGYDLEENGKFAVYLDSKCEIDIPSAFPVVYSKKITGKLSYGHLKDLSGIQVKLYYFWLSITAITAVDDALKFEVGYISATYPVHPNFDENPECVNSFDFELLPMLAQ